MAAIKEFVSGLPDAQARQLVLAAIPWLGADVFDIQVKTQLPMSAIARLAKELVDSFEIEVMVTRDVIPCFRRSGTFWEVPHAQH